MRNKNKCYRLNLQKGTVNQILICCGIDAKPKDSIFLERRGAGIQPRLGKPSGSWKGNIDRNSILSG